MKEESVTASDFGVKLVVNEFKRENLKKIRFQPTAFYYSKKSHGQQQLGLRINEVVNGYKKLVKDCPVINYDPVKNQYKFPVLQFKSDRLADGLIKSKFICIELRSFEENKKKKELKSKELISTCTFSLGDFIGESNSLLQYTLVDTKKKDHGALSISNYCISDYFSFLDLVIQSNLQLVPIIAVDFSLANLTFDIENKCLHTLK